MGAAGTRTPTCAGAEGQPRAVAVDRGGLGQGKATRGLLRGVAEASERMQNAEAAEVKQRLARARELFLVRKP